MNSYDISKLQIERLRTGFAGLTESNHLSRMRLTHPQMMEDVVTMFAMNERKDPTGLFTTLLGGLDFKEVDNIEYTWRIFGDVQFLNEIVEDIALTTPGIGGTPFDIIVQKKIYVVGDILVTDDENTIIVKADRGQVGAGYCYTVEKINPNIQYLDPLNFKKGSRLSKDYTVVGENSERGGSTEYHTGFMMKNNLTTIRQTYSVTRSAYTDVIKMTLPNPQNPQEKITTWVKFDELIHDISWMKEKARLLMYGIYNKDPKGIILNKSAEEQPLYMGAGLREQIAPSNVRYTSRLTYNLLDDFVSDLAYPVTKYGGKFDLYCFTGLQGMKRISKIAQEELGYRQIEKSTNNDKFIQGSEGNLILGSEQFMEIKLLNKISVKFVHLPLFNDTERFRKINPSTGKPFESERLMFVNFGNNGKKSNIRMYSKKLSANLEWYVSGSISPMSGVVKSKTNSSSGKDSYDCHKLSEIGLAVLDPKTMGEIITY